MEIEAKSASLDTMAVTIQALHVSGKQMTLSVFRQLPTISIFDDEGDPIHDAKPWGFVRYDIKGQGDEWAVISKDGKLYRGIMLHEVGTEDRLAREIERLREAAERHDNAFRNHYSCVKKAEMFRRNADELELMRGISSRADATIEHFRSYPQLFIAV